MSDRIQRTASLALGGAVLVVVGWLTFEELGRSPRIRHDAVDASAPSGAGAAGTATSGTTSLDAGPLAPLDPTSGTTGGVGDGGLSLAVPLLSDAGAMPSGAPRAVRIGVVLVQYAGAEGASSSARAKPDALRRARELLEQAKTDFKAAVKAGDSGSAEDIGRIPRGVLEASAEVAIFSLSAGDVSDPIETPRGFWVVKRLE